MIILFIYLLIITLPVKADNTFYFQAYKDPNCNYALSTEFLTLLKQEFNIDTFIETGTYAADTTAQAASIFESVYTFELDPHLFKAAQKKLHPFKNITMYQGDSGEGLRKILPTIQGNILFWLDAHYSGPGTAQNSKNGPLIDELKAIQQSCPNCVILIDDMSHFKSFDNAAEPALPSIISALKAINTNFTFALLRGILLVFDRTKFTPAFSPVVQACTANRIFLSSLSDQELLKNDSIIGNAQDQELASIKAIYRSTQSGGNEYDFTSLLWYALTLLEQQQYLDAYEIFNTITVSGQYNHWRVRWYASFCAFNLIKSNTNFLEKFMKAIEGY